jgi:hypothetical protein
MPRVSIGPAYTAPEGTRAPVGLFVNGIMVPGVKMLIADGGDVVVVLDREQVRIDPAATVEAPIGALATDGAA